MSSNMQEKLPPAATKVGGMRLPAPYRPPAAAKEEESATPQTNIESALSTSSRTEDLLQLQDEPKILSVHDAAEHPKANASTYFPPEPKHQENVGKHRANAHGNVRNLQQPGGAYGAIRH